MTLNGVIAPKFALFCTVWRVQQKCSPKNVVFRNISLMAILAGDHP